ncbi:transporter [Sphingomonas sp. RT2P30]|uniref:transporter n=1 Tax=Parasphingomonas halimpatiens TaxID=3096162 RepID=UPI002FCB9888
MKKIACAVLTLLLVPTAALAKDRDYCPTRPGLGTTPCTIAPGRVSVETALTDWTLEQDSTQRSDTVLIGDTFARLGLSDSIEAQFGWTPFGHVRTRDKLAGTVDSTGRVGDVTLGLKANLLHPDGSGVSIAVQPFVTLPVGRAPVGAGDWGAGVVVPVTFDLSDTVNFATTTEADAAVDQDGHGRHFAASETLGLGFKLSKSLTATIEGQVLRDQDPSGATTQGLASLSLAWMAKDNLQFDIGAVAGLNRDAPDAEVYVGISRRF